MQLFDPGPHGPIGAGLAFTPDGRFLVLVARTDSLSLIDTQTGEVRRAALPHATWPKEGVAFTPDGRSVFLADHEKRLRLYDPTTGQPRPGFEEAGVVAVLAPPGGKVVYAAHRQLVNDRNVTDILRWDAATLARLDRFGRHAGADDVMAVSGDGTRFASASGKYTRVWNLAGDKPPARATCQMKTQGWVKSLALSKDGGLVAGAVRDRVVVWDARTGEEKFRHAKHKKAVNAVAISPTRPLLVSGGNDKLVFVFDAETGKELRRLEWGIGPALALAFAPDGLRCAAADDGGKVVVWDVDG